MSSKAAKKPEVLASAYGISDHNKGTKRVSIPMPLPCITILVHGVNDVGEAYEAQESGLCKGLNARLDRAHKLALNAWGDLTASGYRMPPPPGDDGKEGLQADPDAVYFRRTPDRRTWSPVVPFYWGMREEERHIQKHNWHGQWTDRYGNRLDKNGAKNGGPFANATTTLNALWGDGFSGKVGGSETFADVVSSPLHNLKKAAPRHYMLLAAQRLAMLIKMIRTKEGYEHVAINLLCHSQGSMVALTAHALLAAEKGGCKADTLILQDPPYSLEETVLEHHDGVTGADQQTTVSRIRTLGNIIRYIHGDPHDTKTPTLADLKTGSEKQKEVAGPNWQPDAGSQQWSMGQVHTFTERDNRGKVYLYFCQDDCTVALMSVQGIGWQGVPDTVRTLARRYGMPGLVGKVDVVDAVEFTNEPALSALGEGFRQRVFTARQVNGQPVMVGMAPARYELRSSSGVWPLTEENSTTGNMSASVKQIARGAVRYINGEELHPKVTPILNVGEAGHRRKLGVSPIDAAIAITGDGAIKTSTCRFQEFRTGSRRRATPLTPEELGILEASLPGQRQGADLPPDDRLRVVSVWVNVDTMEIRYSTETANEARARWQNHATDDNSYHSAIPGNPAHTAGVTAYDVSLGEPLPISDDDKAYLAYLCAVADWRTNWKAMADGKYSNAEINTYKLYKAETQETKKLIADTAAYYSKGLLPASIAENGIVQLARPTLVAHHTVSDRLSGKTLD